MKREKNARLAGQAELGTPLLGLDVHRMKEGPDEEMHLVELLKRGDSRGVEWLIERYHDRLYPVAYRICGNHPDTEEVLQDVYMTAVQKIDRFEGRCALATWLYRITVNAALMKRRSQRRIRAMVSMESVGPFMAQGDDRMRVDEQGRSQDDRVMTRELYEKIHEIVEGLPEIYQAVFLLRDVHGYSIKETSGFLKATPAAIKSRLHRGRFFIREELKRYFAEY